MLRCVCQHQNWELWFWPGLGFPHSNWCNMQRRHNVIKQICNWTKKLATGNYWSHRNLLEIRCLLSDHFRFWWKEIVPKNKKTWLALWVVFFVQDISWPWKWVVGYLWMELRGQAPSVNPSGTCDRLILSKSTNSPMYLPPPPLNIMDLYEREAISQPKTPLILK